MKIEIWSDVMCPFCYIGKRKFETALDQFEHKPYVELVWKSYQLNPNLVTDPNKNIHSYLAEIKGWSLEQAKQMNQRVTQMASDVGLAYQLDRAIVANSFDAHRLTHLAKIYGKQSDAEEVLFKAYFEEGKNTADHQTLINLAESIGLEKSTVSEMLNSQKFADEVRQDIYEAQQIEVTGVPFFVLANKYAISGAQETDMFLAALNQCWQETLAN